MVLETTSRALWGRGAGCLSSVGTYLPGTVNAVRHVFNSSASCRCFKKNSLHWALKEINYRSISDDDRCDFTVIHSFFGLE